MATRNVVGAAVMAFALFLAHRVLSRAECADTTSVWIVLGVLGIGALIYDTKEGIKNIIDGIKAWKGHKEEE